MVAAARFGIIALALLLSSRCAKSEAPPTADAPSTQTRAAEQVSCQEPENPYDEEDGGFDGFEFAKKNPGVSCDSYHRTVIEGCAEYRKQAEAYAACQRSR
jgi:hypothetical protein